MVELAFDELSDIGPARDLTRSHAARVLVVDDDKTDRYLTICLVVVHYKHSGSVTVGQVAAGPDVRQFIERELYHGNRL